MRMPSHTALCSFIFSAILTSALVPSSGNVALASAGAPAVQMAVQSALNGLRAQGFAGSAGLVLPAPAAVPTSAPAAAVAAPGSPLTSEIMTKMLQLIALRGTDRDVPAAYANAMGLSATGQTWPDRQTVALDTSSHINHGFAVGRGNNDDILLLIRHTDGLHAFRAHRDGKIVIALISDNPSQITVRNPAEAQIELDVELAFWAANVDNLIAHP